MSQETVTRAPTDSGVPAHARDFSVTGRVVVVTGAGQGIGREIARQFAEAGAKVVVADLDLSKASRTAEEISARGKTAIAVGVDVSSQESTERMAETIVTQYGRIDVLVNNAAIFAAINKITFDQIPIAEWEKVLAVNVTGTYLCARAVAQHMRDQRWGRIINISSDSVPRGIANYLHYVTSKSAVIGMTNSLAKELGGYEITVNCIRPGATATEVDRHHNPTIAARESISMQQCLHRGQLPEDLAGLTIFLSTEAAGFITGQTIAVDGGLTHSS